MAAAMLIRPAANHPNALITGTTAELGAALQRGTE
jgi:hypothetical protein